VIARPVALALLLFSFASCAGLVVPKPTTSEYFQSELAGFSIDTENRTIHYALVLGIRSPISAGAVLEASFENPTGARNLSGERTPGLKEGLVGFTSTPVRGLRSMGVYEAVVRVYSDESRSSLLSTHTQLIRSEIDQNRLSGY
jgi:hypothetical protein